MTQEDSGQLGEALSLLAGGSRGAGEDGVGAGALLGAVACRELAGDDRRTELALGEVGELVGTGFLNRGMRLIRYRTGDFGSLSSVECACGRRYPILESVIGRRQDHLVTKSGRLIPVTGMLFGAHLPEYARIERIQLEQKEPGRAIVRVVPGAACQARDLEGVVRAFEDICDAECRFEVEQVEDIATTESGKYRYVIQNVDIDNIVGESKANEADHPELSDG